MALLSHPTPDTQRTAARATGVILVVLFAVLYLLTLDNGLRPEELAGGDLITHQYAQVQGRPSNAPGYPLYTMGGWLWFRAGRALLGADHNPIPILSSYSTLWALASLALLHALILECLGAARRWPIAFLASAFYGLTYFFWYYAVTTEQYTSSVAWTLAVCLLAFKWERSGEHPERVHGSTQQTTDDQSKDAPRPRILRLRASRRDAPPLRMLANQGRAPASRDDRYLLALAFLAGIGLAHQVTVLFAVPPLLWFVLSRESGLLRRPRLSAAALGLALLPLLSYAYIYIRGSQHPEWRGMGVWTSSWHWFLSFVSTGQGRSELTWALQPFLTAEFPALIWREMTWPGLLAGLAGLAALPRRRAVTLYAILAIYLVFCWIDRLGNWFQVIMPAYALLAVGIAAGAAWLWESVSGAQLRRPSTGAVSSPPLSRSPAQDAPQHTQSKHPERMGAAMRRTQSKDAPHVQIVHLWRGAILAALVALAAYRGLLSYPAADASDRPEDTALAPAWAILADDPPPGTAVFGTQPEVLALSYVTDIWGQRPDLRPVTSKQARSLLPAPGFAATEAALPLVPLEISTDARYSALGRTLVAVADKGQNDQVEMEGELAAWEHDFGGQVRLVGGRWGVNRATGETVVMLAWQAGPALEAEWSVSVRLAQDGVELAQVDRAQPVFGVYPMSRWQPGEVVMDAYPFRLPPAAAPDTVIVILYRQTETGFENLDVFSRALQE